MKRLLCILFLARAVSVFGASPSVSGISIDTNGWAADIYIDNVGVPTNGAYQHGVFNFGFATNNTGTSKIVLSLTSPGFDDTGNSNNVSRTIYGTKEVRLPYPNQTNVYASANGGGAIIRIALSDYIFTNDYALTATIAANWYSNNTASSVTVTNLSWLGYQKCVANWTWPGWQRIAGNTMTLRAVGFHWSGQQGRPLRAMRFVATGSASHVTVTNWVTTMTLDRAMGDAVPFGEYIANMDISGMTQGENVRCDFTAYPWIGTSASIMDTMDNAYTLLTMNYASITNLCDRTLGYAGANGCWALVATNGSDATGVAQTNAVDTGSPPAAFLTMNGALLAIKGTNNAKFGHNDVGGGIVYLSEGNNWAWLGGSGAYTTKPSTWCTVTRWPTNTVGQVIINAVSGNQKIADRTKVDGVTIMLTNASGGIKSEEALWVDRCFIDTTNGLPFYLNTLWYTTRCTAKNMSENFKPFSTTAMGIPLVRGNLVTNVTALIHTVVGNFFASGSSSFQLNDIVSTGTQPNYAPILYNNLLEPMNGANVTAFGVDPKVTTNGFVVVQNVIEHTGASQPLFSMHSNDLGHDSSTNAIMWYNTFINERLNVAYEDVNSNNSPQICWSVKGNFVDDWNCKDDANYGNPSFNGARTNNWGERWSVGFAGNWFNEFASGAGIASGSFTNEFAGINSYNPAGTSADNFPDFIGRLTENYRVTSKSPMCGVVKDWWLPFDIEGNARGQLDPPGAYASACPRKSAGFFGQ